MAFEYYNLLGEHPAVLDALIPVGEFLRWGKEVEPTSVAVDIERGLYYTHLYSLWGDDGVASVIVIGGEWVVY